MSVPAAEPDVATLTADLQAHYGAMCRLVRDGGPYPALWHNGFSSLDERELADLLAGADCAAAAAPAPQLPHTDADARTGKS